MPSSPETAAATATPALASLLATTADAMLWLGELEAGDEPDTAPLGASASTSASTRPAASLAQKKRACGPIDSGDVSSDSSGGDKTAGEQQGVTKKKRKYRKATHTIRKVRLANDTERWEPWRRC
jgi:hypothetical protein